MSKLKGFIKSIINACPYTITGKKCLNIIRGNTVDKPCSSDKIQKYRKGIKTGFNISLIGVFCPFLWYSIFTGKSKNFIFLNMIHSGVILSIGVLLILINYLLIIYYRKSSI